MNLFEPKLNEQIEYKTSSNNCVKCTPNDKTLVVTSIDGLCSAHRRENNDSKACGKCKREYKGENGWYVPSFGSYSDLYYWCNVCIPKLQKEVKTKRSVLSKIPKLEEQLNKQLKSDPSPIYKKGRDYIWDGYSDSLSLLDFQKEVKSYKKNKNEIEAIRNKNYEIEKQLDKLRERENNAFAGSGFWVEPNT